MKKKTINEISLKSKVLTKQQKQNLKGGDGSGNGVEAIGFDPVDR